MTDEGSTGRSQCPCLAGFGARLLGDRGDVARGGSEIAVFGRARPGGILRSTGRTATCGTACAAGRGSAEGRSPSTSSIGRGRSRSRLGPSSRGRCGVGLRPRRRLRYCVLLAEPLLLHPRLHHVAGCGSPAASDEATERVARVIEEPEQLVRAAQGGDTLAMNDLL